MTPYQLPTGKTIFIDSLHLLTMTDEDISNLIANDSGFVINDPFYGSTIHSDKEESDGIKDLILLESPDIDEIEEIDISGEE